MKHFIKQMWNWTQNGVSCRVFLENRKAKAPLIKTYNHAVRRRKKIYPHTIIEKPLFLSKENAEIVLTKEFMKKCNQDPKDINNKKLVQMFWLLGIGKTQARTFVFFVGKNQQNKANFAAQIARETLGMSTFSVDVELHIEENNRQ